MFKRIVLLFLLILFATPCFAQDIVINNTIAENERTPYLKHNRVNWGSYMREVEARIKKNWHPPKNEYNKKVVCLLKVEKDGTVSDIKIVTSGGEEYDKAAIEAIKKFSV